jgi:Sulfatase-modifying factor enzyme 1
MNRRDLIISAAVVWLGMALPAQALTLRCPPDSVKVGTTCVDTYEASLWQIDPANTTLVRKVQTGRVTLADLQAGGAIPLSPSACIAMNVFTNFPRSGNWTAVPGSNPPSPGFYAVSVAGVQPSRCITWFQANQACLLSGKRLLTNREWQGAAAGTPDPGVADDGSTTCATINSVIANTGSRSSCKSVWGAFDMIGNVDEWVGDWADRSVSCTNWPASLGSDFSRVGGPGDPGGQSGTLSLPGAFLRGGSSLDGTEAGVFAINSGGDPSQRSDVIGFRCAR